MNDTINLTDKFNEIMNAIEWMPSLEKITLPKEAHIAARCPQCHAYAELFTTGQYAGIWACTNSDCMASDNCEHLTVHPEEFTIMTETRNDKVVLNICNVCSQNVEEEN